MQGKIVITTQPADQAGALLELLRHKGADARNMPMIETRTRALEKELMEEHLPGHPPHWLVFTSRKGVKGFFENLQNHFSASGFPAQTRIAVVGVATAEALHEFGQKATLINPEGNARSLSVQLQEQLKGGEKILLALGNLAPTLLQEQLAHKAKVYRWDVYDTHPVKNVDPQLRALIEQEKAHMCIFTSPSGFYAFLDIFTNPKTLNLAAIGATTASAIREAGYPVAATASHPTPQALAEAIEEFFRQKPM